MAKAPDGESRVFNALEGMRQKLAAVEARKPGAFQFQLTGEEAGEFAIEVDGQREVKLVTGKSERTPRNLVAGDGRKIRMVLEGEQDAATAFISGGIQFRGDVRYLERLLKDLKLLKRREVK